MKTLKKELVNELLAALAPQLSDVVPAGQKPPKGLLKTVRHLAEQLLRARMKQEKRAARAATLPPKEAKQKLTDELSAVLDAHFEEEVLAEKEMQLLTETAEELAGKLTKLRSKQARRNKKDSASAAETAEASSATTPAKRVVRRPANPSLPEIASQPS